MTTDIKELRKIVANLSDTSYKLAKSLYKYKGEGRNWTIIRDDFRTTLEYYEDKLMLHFGDYGWYYDIINFQIEDKKEVNDLTFLIVYPILHLLLKEYLDKLTNIQNNMNDRHITFQIMTDTLNDLQKLYDSLNETAFIKVYFEYDCKYDLDSIYAIQTGNNSDECRKYVKELINIVKG